MPRGGRSRSSRTAGSGRRTMPTPASASWCRSTRRSIPCPPSRSSGRRKGIPVGALVAFVLARYCASGSEALLYAGPVVVRQMEEIVRKAEAAGTDAARLDAYRALSAIVSWLRVPLEDPSWRPGG